MSKAKPESELAVADPSPPAPATSPEELMALSTEQLRAELARSLELTAAHLLRLAWVVRTLEERGEDLSDLRVGMLGHLRRIAYGQVLPEVVVRYAEFPTLMRRIESLPLPDQRRLASGESVPVAVRAADGSITHRLLDPIRMTADQVRLAFGASGLRDQSEQAAILESRPPRRPAPRHSVRVGRLTVDRKAATIAIGRARVPLASVLEAVAALRGEDDPDRPDDDGDPKLVPVKLSAGEHDWLARRALDGGTSMTALIRRAMAAAGLLGGD